VTEVTEIAGDGAALARPGAHDDAKWTNRTGEDSAPVLFSVMPSLCFHIVFLAKRTDWTDLTGITVGCSVRTATSSILRRLPHDAAAARDAAAVAIPALSQSQQFQRADRAIAEAAPLDRGYNSTQPRQVACTSLLPDAQNRSGWVYGILAGAAP